jgi:hypothetical protein
LCIKDKVTCITYYCITRNISRSSSGTAESNATVELFNGTTSLGTVTVNSGGNFTLDIDLSAGSLHNVTAQATDAAGNVSDVSAVLAIRFCYPCHQWLCWYFECPVLQML